MDWLESSEAIGQVDELLARIGLEHGRRKSLAGTWHAGERRPRKPSPATQTGPQPVDSLPSTHPIDVLRVPGWEKYPWLRHGFSTRAGGVTSVYRPDSPGELNLGFTKEDDPANVAENRRRFLAEAVAAAPSSLVTLRQFHSGMVRLIDSPTAPIDSPDTSLQSPEGRAVLRGDAAMTRLPGLVLGIQTADCAPVLVADVRRRVVAAFHAGWRGTLARIVQRGIGAMRLQFGSRPQDLVAAVGPAIGPCCYSVGEEVRFEFDSQFAYAPQLFSEVCDSHPVRDKYPLLFLTARAPGHSNIGPQIHLDLWEANRRQLLEAGLKPSRIWVARECTACAQTPSAGPHSPPSKYFSHRGESGFAGRMMAVIGTAP